MSTEKPFRFYTSEEIKNVTSLINNELTAMNKYTVLPVYFLQFIIRKATMEIIPIVFAYDNRKLVLELANVSIDLHNTIIDKTPKTIYPTAIVYPKEIEYSFIIYNKSEAYWYSSTYIIAGKELKPLIAKDKLKFTNIILYSDEYKKHVKTLLEWEFYPEDDEERKNVKADSYIAPINDYLPEFHLPFINYVKKNTTFKSILESIIHMDNFVAFDTKLENDSFKISEMVNMLKNVYETPIPTTNVYIYKDFVKQRPSYFRKWSALTKLDDNFIQNVAINMTFKDLSVILFYRYIDGIDSVSNQEETEIKEENKK